MEGPLNGELKLEGVFKWSALNKDHFKFDRFKLRGF